MAEFYLQNEYGEEIDLQDETKYCIATDVSGLGFSYSSDYIAIGDHFVRNYLNPEQDVLTLDLNFFRPEVYEKQQLVTNFIVTAEQLYLIYKPDLASGIEYTREVEVTSYKKNGVKDGYLDYQLTLACLSLFYYKKRTRFEITELEGEKRYDFTWDAAYNDYSNRTLEIPGDNHVELSFDIEINGYTENPMIELLDEHENVIWSLVFPVTLQEGEKVIYSSSDDGIYVKFIDAEGNERNMYNDFDLSTVIFTKIPKSGATVRFTSDTDVMNTIVFTTYAYFKAV